MGAEILIRTIKDDAASEKLTPFLGRDFTFEICNGFLWYERKPFLSERETKLLIPLHYDDFDDGIKKPINPSEFLLIIAKIKQYLKTNQNELPFEIEIDYEKMEQEGLSTDIVVNNSRCWMQGDSYVYEVSTKVRIVNYPLEPTDVDLWVEVKDKIEIEDRTYYLKKVSRYERYVDSLDKIIAFCEHAKRIKQQIYWIYYH